MATKKRNTKKKGKRAAMSLVKGLDDLGPDDVAIEHYIYNSMHHSYSTERDDSDPLMFPSDRFRQMLDGSCYVVDMKLLPKCCFPLLLQQRLSKEQRSRALRFFIGGEYSMDQLLDRRCSSFMELVHVIQVLVAENDGSTFKGEAQILGRWYPMNMSYRLYSSFFGRRLLFTSSLRLAYGGETVNFRSSVWDDVFRDENGLPVSLTVREALKKSAIRPCSSLEEAANNGRLARARALGAKYGSQVMVSTDVIAKGEMWFGPPIEEIKFGSSSVPRRVIIEPELELSERDNDGDDDASTTLPFVRVFSMDLKRYVYADVDSVTPYAADDKALSKLVLPSNVLGLVKGLFEAHNDDMFGDVLSFKHGGMIICAAGPTGVGKTMTAECFAEHTGRPLYPIELGELGVKLDEIEGKLKMIFSRAKRWNAVLLLDEADVIFQKRNEDLERSAIVGVFLRLLDYYSGFLFLTTNRLETLDAAFESRITLTIKYPDLTPAARVKIWEGMLRAANLQLPIPANVLAEWKLNGRKIRSQVRLMKTLFKGKVTSTEDIINMMNNTVGTRSEVADARGTSGVNVMGDFAKGLS